MRVVHGLSVFTGDNLQALVSGLSPHTGKQIVVLLLNDSFWGLHLDLSVMYTSSAD